MYIPFTTAKWGGAVYERVVFPTGITGYRFKCSQIIGGILQFNSYSLFHFKPRAKTTKILSVSKYLEKKGEIR